MPPGKRYTPEMLGMIAAHFGVALFLAGVLITEATSVERDLRFAPNESQQIAGLDFRFHGVERVQGPNYLADQGTLEVRRDDRLVATLHPQTRQYTGQQLQSKSDIDPGLFRDSASRSASRSARMEPGRCASRRRSCADLLGGLMMMLGGFTASRDRRFRALPARIDSAPAPPTTSPAQAAA